MRTRRLFVRFAWFIMPAVLGGMFTPSEAVGETIWLEAESADYITPWTIASDTNASGGKCLWAQSKTPLTKVNYTFNVPAAGNYTVTARARGYDGGSDSFYFLMDGGEKSTCNGISGSWEQRLLGIYTLSAGSHTFTIMARETLTDIDKFDISGGVGVIEAESGSGIDEVIWGVLPEAEASGGKYLKNIFKGGTAEMVFNVSHASTWFFWARVRLVADDNIRDGESDSHTPYVDGVKITSDYWQLRHNTNWHWEGMGFTTLNPGNHTLMIKVREAGNQIDKICITDDNRYVPKDSSTGVNFGPVMNTGKILCELSRVYSDAFSPSAIIGYWLPIKSNVSLRIYDMTGKLLTTLVKREMHAGYHNVKWNTKAIAQGIYFVSFEVAEHSAVRRIVGF